MAAGTAIVFVLVFIFAIVPFLLPVIFPILQDISKKTSVGTKPNAIHVMDSNIFSIGINMYVWYISSTQHLFEQIIYYSNKIKTNIAWRSLTLYNIYILIDSQSGRLMKYCFQV